MKLNLTISIIRLVFEASKRQWQNESLRSLIELSNGKSMTKSRMTLDGDYPVYGANGVIGRTNEALINTATITIGRVGSCGEINKTDDLAWVSDNAMWVSNRAENLDFDYLYFALKSLNLTSGMKIAAMPSISQENVFRENIPLPSLAEQKQIALFLNQYVQGLGVKNCVDFPDSINAIKSTIARVESLAARVNEAQRLREEAEKYVEYLEASILNSIFSGNLAKDQNTTGKQLLEKILHERRGLWESSMRAKGKDFDKVVYKEPVQPDITNLPPLPSHWCYASADQLTSVITDGEHATPQRTNSGVLLLSARNIRNGYIDLANVDYVAEETYQKIIQRVEIKPGDVLLSCSGSVGRSCVVPENLRFALVRSVAILKPIFVDPIYMSLILQSRFMKDQINSKKTQTAQPNIFQGKIKTLVFPLPPLDEQRRIVAYLDGLQAKVNALRELQSASGEELSALMASVLDRAFKGEL